MSAGMEPAGSPVTVIDGDFSSPDGPRGTGGPKYALYWSNVNATNNNALYTQGLIFTAHTNTSTLFAPNSPSPSVTTHLPVHIITPGNMPTFQSQSPISPRPAHIECHTNNLASSCSHLTYSVSNLFTSLHVYHTPPRLLNILIFKVRSDPGIASPGRFAWA